jgi:tetratricopeptide (TPR) repeat protein
LSELGGYYYGIKEVDKAKQILLLCKELDYINNKTHIYSMLGHVYRNEHQEDSANFYYLKAAANGDIYQAYNNYRHSFMMSNNEGNYAEAVNYIKKALTLKDSIDKITQTETITKINSLYNYQHTETENIRLQFNQERQKNMLYITSFVALLAILTCVFLAVYHKMRKKQALYKQNKREQIVNERYERSQKALQDNLQKISEL